MSSFAESMSKVRNLIYSPVKKTSKLGEKLLNLPDVVEKEHKRLLARKSIIEKRKEEQERHLLEMVFTYLQLVSRWFLIVRFNYLRIASVLDAWYRKERRSQGD